MGIFFLLESFILFWLDADDFFYHKRSPLLQTRATQIYERYIRHGAKFQVILEGELWEDIVQNLEEEVCIF